MRERIPAEISMANVVETGGAKAIDWVPLRYNRVQHVVAEINSLVSRKMKALAMCCSSLAIPLFSIDITDLFSMEDCSILYNFYAHTCGSSPYESLPACFSFRFFSPHAFVSAHRLTAFSKYPIYYKYLYCQALKAKKDRAFLTFLAVDYKDAMKKRAAELKQWSHKAKQEERPEYVLIAKQATRFRQLRSNCEAEVNKVNSGSSTSYGQGSSPALPSASPPVMTPAPLPNSSKVATPPYKSEETSAPTSQSPRSKERRSSVRAAKKRQSSTIAMIKNRLRAAAYHLGKMDFAKLFKYYDRDNSGHIDCKEFMSLIRRDGKIPPSKLSHVQLENIFAAEVDKDGNGEVTHKEFVQWILDDEYFDENGNATSMTDNISTDVHSEPMDTFTRLYLSKPEFTVALKESSPRTRRKSLSEPESGGDFRSILRGGYNSETSRAWRHNYHTKVDTKQTEYPPLYSWEQSTEGEHTYKSGTRQRKFVSPVTKSAERANASNNMANMDKLRNHSKDPSFKNQKNIAFGSRIPPKQPSAEERKKQQAAERAAKLRAEREARDAKPAWRSVCDFQIVMNDDEAALYQRLRLSIPVEKDPFQAVSVRMAFLNTLFM